MAVAGTANENSSSHVMGCNSADSEHEEGSIVTSKPAPGLSRLRNLLALSLGTGITR